MARVEPNFRHLAPALKKWLNAGYMEGSVVKPTQRGTPQGGIISPVLANFASNGLENALKAAFSNQSQLEYLTADLFDAVGRINGTACFHALNALQYVAWAELSNGCIPDMQKDVSVKPVSNFCLCARSA